MSGFAGAGLALALLGLRAAKAPPASPQPVGFGCRVVFRDELCRFQVVRPDGTSLRFVLHRSEVYMDPDAHPLMDRYLVSIDRPLPQDWRRCGRVRGVWCKLSRVRTGTNF